ncbi:conserved hypothetical protein [Trichinella spiralis]|uniref:hypothetical protein n=1 Tax=Trichinella spiralis TaxID=6334 RepID=UPI0001EFE4B4|nr:conserved hypothetical protein [Trichinella spiralis]
MSLSWLMLQTHKYHINTAITGACIKQPFIILYMLEFILMLKAKPKIRPPLHALWNEMSHQYRPLVDSSQHITEWKDSSVASKAEQLRVAVCRGSFVLSLAVLSKVLALALPLSKSFQDSCLEVFSMLRQCEFYKNGGLNQRSVFVRFGKQPKNCTIFVTHPIDRASAERSFTAVKYLKSYFRTSMTEERLNRLAAMCTFILTFPLIMTL